MFRRRQGGFTLIELLVALAIIALVSGAAVVGMRRVMRTEIRTAATKLSGAMRYLFDRASVTGRVHRLVVDLDEGKYWAEVSDDRYTLPGERETDESRLKEAEEIAAEQEERKRLDELAAAAGSDTSVDVTKYLPEEFRPKRARFSAFKEMAVKPIEVKSGVKLAGLFTPRLAEPMSTGQGFIYFFPLGLAEAAMLTLTDETGETVYTLQLHPLTGRVRVVNQRLDPPVEERFDDEGNKVLEP